jgi:hypothetical protein
LLEIFVVCLPFVVDSLPGRRIVGGAASADSVDNSIVVGADIVPAVALTATDTVAFEAELDVAVAGRELSETGVKGVDKCG